MTPGGDYGVSQSNETNGRAILTKSDVIRIRTLYGNRVPFRKAYEEFERVISKRGFQNV